MKSLSRVRLFETSWTVAYQDPQPVGFLPGKSTGDLAKNLDIVPIGNGFFCILLKAAYDVHHQHTIIRAPLIIARGAKIITYPAEINVSKAYVSEETHICKY